ncbi:MAG: hypothetical protein ACYDIC_09695 [Desulfobaccales bacterium]
MVAQRKIPKGVTKLDDKKDFTYLKGIEKKVLGIEEDDPKPYIVLKYYHPKHQCFSTWSKGDLKAFSSLIERMRTARWSLLINNQALGFKINKYIDSLPKGDVDCLKKILSPDITFAELTVSEKARIHGFRIGAAFYLVWLDKDHNIYSMS